MNWLVADCVTVNEDSSRARNCQQALGIAKKTSKNTLLVRVLGGTLMKNKKEALFRPESSVSKR